MTRQNQHIAPQFLTLQEVADWLTIPPSTLRWWRQTGDGPPSFRLGKSVRYDRADVEAWVERQRRSERER